MNIEQLHGMIRDFGKFCACHLLFQKPRGKAGEMDKSVNCLPCEHEHALTHTCNSNTRELETGGSLPLLAS